MIQYRIAGGKAAMKSGVAEFSKAAKAAYSNLSVSDRKKLKEQSTAITEGELTKKRIRQEGAKIFRKIQSLVRNWIPMCWASHTIVGLWVP